MTKMMDSLIRVFTNPHKSLMILMKIIYRLGKGAPNKWLRKISYSRQKNNSKANIICFRIIKELKLCLMPNRRIINLMTTQTSTKWITDKNR